MLLGAGVVAWKVSRAGRTAEPTPAAAVAEDRRRLLAVFPFENISRDRDAYFAAGMTEEITSRLSQLSALRVVGRTAVAQFKDPRSQLPTMAKELGIGSVVTGTVREDGGRVRVNVELVDAQSGQVLWSDQYDREGMDVFAAQSDIALHVSEALEGERDAGRAGAPRQAPDLVVGRLRVVHSRAHATGEDERGAAQCGHRSAAAGGDDRPAICPSVHLRSRTITLHLAPTAI